MWKCTSATFRIQKISLAPTMVAPPPRCPPKYFSGCGPACRLAWCLGLSCVTTFSWAPVLLCSCSVPVLLLFLRCSYLVVFLVTCVYMRFFGVQQASCWVLGSPAWDFFTAFLAFLACSFVLCEQGVGRLISMGVQPKIYYSLLYFITHYSLTNRPKVYTDNTSTQ